MGIRAEDGISGHFCLRNSLFVLLYFGVLLSTMYRWSFACCIASPVNFRLTRVRSTLVLFVLEKVVNLSVWTVCQNFNTWLTHRVQLRTIVRCASCNVDSTLWALITISYNCVSALRTALLGWLCTKLHHFQWLNQYLIWLDIIVIFVLFWSFGGDYYIFDVISVKLFSDGHFTSLLMLYWLSFFSCFLAQDAFSFYVFIFLLFMIDQSYMNLTCLIS